MSKPKQEISYQVGTCEGVPIVHHLSVEEQIEIEKSGITVNEYIDMDIQSYRDWQSDC